MVREGVDNGTRAGLRSRLDPERDHVLVEGQRGDWRGEVIVEIVRVPSLGSQQTGQKRRVRDEVTANPGM